MCNVPGNTVAADLVDGLRRSPAFAEPTLYATDHGEPADPEQDSAWGGDRSDYEIIELVGWAARAARTLEPIDRNHVCKS